MMRRGVLFGILLCASLMIGQLPGPSAPEHVHAEPALQATATPGSSYLKNWENVETTSPLDQAASSDLDITVHSRDTQTWNGLEPMTIAHGSMCEAPPATHSSGDPMPYADATFVCNKHMMTAIKAGGYGLITMMPGAQVDWSGGESVVRFDVSTLRASQRDWWDLWLTPFDDLMVEPLNVTLPDLQGPPARGLNMEMSGFNGGTVFLANRFEAPSDIPPSDWAGRYEDVITPSATIRSTFELRISSTHIRFALLSPTTGLPVKTWVDGDFVTPLAYTSGVLQLEHHSYNPEKACEFDGTCGAGTFHWDNLSINPATPLTIIPAHERRANETQDTYTFASPAPQDAKLGLEVRSDSMEMSTDGGTTWSAVHQQPSPKNDSGLMRMYWQDVPAGTTAVKLRGTGGWAGPWEADHAVIVSRASQQTAPTPTLIPPTNTAIPTVTPVPTFTPGPTSTPVPIPTATTVPTSTTVPAVTATPTFQPDPVPTSATGCHVQVTRDGTPEAVWDCR